MRRRAKILARAAEDDSFAAACLARSRRDPVWWCNTFVWTYDPRLPAKGMPAYLPFDLYPRQVELVEWIQQCRRDQANGAVPKCRGVGATWVADVLSAWMWLFERGVSITWGSRKEELVDKLGDPNSIFEKIRIILRRLPAWMLPPGFDWGEHSNHRRLINPHTGAVIVGEQGRNMGRGGRSSIYFRDEAAHGEGLAEIERAVLENSDCVIDISTPNGLGNPFERKVGGGHVRVFEMSWDSVPWRDQGWLEKKRLDYAHDPAGFAQEIMIDFAGSTENAVIPPGWVRSCMELEEDVAGSVLHMGLDVAESNDLNVLAGRSRAQGFIVDHWTNLDTTQTARRAVAQANEMGAAQLYYDPIGVGAGVSGELANHEGRVRFRWKGVNVGDRPTKRKWPSGKRSFEMFANLKAELWWSLRERARKTHEHVTGVARHPLDELLSLKGAPDKLRVQLSWPKWDRNSSGKIRIESKDAMKKRLGTRESPDFAEALVLAFAEDVLGSGILAPLPTHVIR